MPKDQKWMDEVASRGRALYRENIKPLVDPFHIGKFVVIDVETGDYEMAERIRIASKKLRQRRPEAITYAIRVGFVAARRMGGRNWIPGNDDRNG